MMNSILKDYMDEQQLERIAHLVAKNMEKTLQRDLTEDEVDFTQMVTKSTFKKYEVESVENIMVTDTKNKERLDQVLHNFVDSLSELMVFYIYSRLEAYILYKKVKELQNGDKPE